MIRKKHKEVEYEVAECDGCGDDLRDDIGNGHANVNYGLLKGSFGWGSPFDEIHSSEHHLCEACWVRVLALFNIPVWVESDGTRFMPDGRTLDHEGQDTGEAWDIEAEIQKARKTARVWKEKA